MTDPHAVATAPADDEPKSPMWLPVLGAALFVGAGVAWAVTPSAAAPNAAEAPASIAPSASALPPSPAARPPAPPSLAPPPPVLPPATTAPPPVAPGAAVPAGSANDKGKRTRDTTAQPPKKAHP